MKNDLALPKRALWRTAFVILAVLLTVSVAITSICLGISTDYALTSSNDMKQNALNLYQREVETSIGGILQQVQLFALQDIVWSMVYSDDDNIDYILLRSLLQEIKNYYSMSPLVESIYLFDQAHGYILADSFYKKNSFYDDAVLTEDFANARPVSSVRTVNGKAVFSLIYRPFTNIASNPLTIVVNLSVSEIEKLLPFSTDVGHFAMTNGRNEILYASNDSDDISGLIQRAAKLPDDQNIVCVGDEQYLVTRATQLSQGIRLFIFQDYQTATHARAIIRHMTLPAMFITLIGAVSLALAAAFYLYNPLQKLIRSLKIDGEVNGVTSEYALIGRAFNHLETSKKEYEKKYKEASCYQDLYVLQEFLINPKFNNTEFNTLTQRLELEFDKKLYTLIVVASQNDYIQQLNHAILPDAPFADFSMRWIVSRISRDRIAILLNHDSDNDANECAQRVLQWFTSRGFDPCLAQSEPFCSVNELPVHYNRCDTTLRQQMFLGRNERAQLLPEASAQAAKLRKDFLVAVKAGDVCAAEEMLNGLIELYQKQYPLESIELLHHQLSALCLDILGTAQNDGLAVIFMPEYKRFQNMCAAKNLNEIYNELDMLIREVIDKNSQLAQKRYDTLVENAKRFIDQNITRNLSLDDIAQSVYLSSNYFCAVFKTETGITPMDYVMRKRIELACQMLLQSPRLRINELAVRISYNSAQSFIRQFKKVCQTTPDQYRKNHML